MARIKKGDRLGPYSLVEPRPELQTDSAIEVWLAQVTHWQQVILKIFRIPHEGLDEEHRRAYATFRKEAELLQKLHHLNIVRIYPLHREAVSTTEEGYLAGSLGRDETWWFWAMERLPDESLAKLLASRRQETGGRLYLEEAVKIASQVGEALDYIHFKKIVHVNIHPQTIFFRYPLSGPKLKVEVVLTDFGGATTADGPPSDQPLEPPRQSSMDVYALGALLYEMLTGAPPFTGRDEDLERAALETAPPPLPRFDVPPEIEGLIFHALRKDPAERPSVEEILTTLDKSVPPPRRFGRRMAVPVERRAPAEPPRALGASDADGQTTRSSRPWLLRAPRLRLRRRKSYPVPGLREPKEGAVIKGVATFAWQWPPKLKDNEVFQLRIWKEGEDRQRTPVYVQRECKLDIDLDSLLSERAEEGDKCFWSVVVVQKNVRKNTRWELSKEALPRSFTYAEPPAEEEAEREGTAELEVGEGN